MAVELRNITSRKDEEQGESGHENHKDYENQAYDEDGEITPNHETDSTNSTVKSVRHRQNVDHEKNMPIPDCHGTSYEDDDDNVDETRCTRHVGKIQDLTKTFLRDNSRIIKIIFYVVLAVLYLCYFGYCMYYEFGSEGSIRLLAGTCVAACIIVSGIAMPYILKQFEDRCTGSSVFAKKPLFFFKWFLHIGLGIFIIVYVIVNVAIDNPENLISAAGMAVYILLFYIFSKSPAKVRWHPVYYGLIVQFVFALLILRTTWGYAIFTWIGDRFTELLDNTDVGASFVFGAKYKIHFFAFKVLPTITFFSALVSVAYYLGVMQFVVGYIAKFIAFCMSTTPAESLNAAANIFVGQTEAPLMIRPFLDKMTHSELHAVMTGGFATIAGGVLAAFMGFGVPANHLISASVMSAPAALAMSKLFYPEIEKSKATRDDFNKMEASPERNIIEAASVGASISIKLVANITVNLLAFLAILSFVNNTLTWFGNRAGVEKLTFELICSYALWPFAYVMGVNTDDCRTVAELMGVKTFINEFVAFERLGVYINNTNIYSRYVTLFNDTSDVVYSGDDIFLVHDNRTLVGGTLERRSQIIATYALCGFSNVGSIGIMLGGLGAIAPSRKKELPRIVIRAMIAGNVACFMTACIAGLLYRADLETAFTD